MEERPTYDELLEINRRQSEEINYLKGLKAAGFTLEDIQTILAENDRLRNEKESLSIIAKTDSLTGLPNLTAFQGISEIPSGWALVIFDLDNFKKVNDTYGHNKGDEVLQTLSQAIKENIFLRDIYGLVSSEEEKGEFPARIGGDEFLLVLKNCDYSHAVEKSESIKTRFSQLCIENYGLNLTASSGVYFCEEDLSLLEAKEVADQKLYEAKKDKAGGAR